MSAKQTDSVHNKSISKTSPALRAAAGGAALSLALILAYTETVIPIELGIPGIKLGLPNVVMLFLLYKYGWKYAFAVSLLRIVISGMLFGSLPSFIYSLAGGLISITVMAVLKKSDTLSPTGVSVAGGVTHNIAQIFVAVIILGTSAVVYYLPPLIIGGTASGALIGLLGSIIIKKVRI